MEYKMLNNGVEMPMVGLGVYNISQRETQRVVETAIEVGYRSIVTAAVWSILEHIARFHAEQLSSEATKANDLLTRFENLLNRYYSDGTYREHGLPTVKYCAQGLFLSPNYFGDLIKEITGDTAGNTIRRFVMKRAQQLLFSGCSVSQTADQLGFDYPQHFTRMFKKCYGMSPSDYLKQMRSK